MLEEVSKAAGASPVPLFHFASSGGQARRVAAQHDNELLGERHVDG